MKSFKSFSEEMTFKVDVEGLPAMYVNGNSPGEVKAHLRKLVKQPSMIKSVKRQTKHDVKKMYRDKAQGKNVEEGYEGRPDGRLPLGKRNSDHPIVKKAKELVKTLPPSKPLKDLIKKEAIKYTHVAVDKKGKVAGMASKASDAKDMARRHGGTHHQLKKPMHPKVGDMMINKSYNPVLTKEMTQQSKTHPNLKVAVGKSAQSAKDSKARADKRRAQKAGTPLAADTSGNVDYGSDKSVKIMKKKTPGEMQERNCGCGQTPCITYGRVKEGNGLWANIHAKRRRGERMRKKGEKGAPTPAAIRSAQKNEKISIGKIRRAAYKTGRVLGDVSAVKKGKVARRVKNRVVGKLLGKAVGKLGLFK
tara:strand:+ start:251 stop:1336 length:1086 start_codon:yes stop_codon:yes gene_type:complete